MGVVKQYVVGAIAVMLVLSTFSLATLAQGSQFCGEWEGAIDAPGAKLGIVVRIQQNENGTLGGSVDIPMQKSLGLQLNQFTTDGDAISFAFTAIPASFQGRLSADGNTLEGTYLQGGMKMPFNVVRKGTQTKADPLAGLSEFVKTAMLDFNVQGVAIAIVKDQQVIYQEGFGMRDMENGLPVTPDTMFQIGSTTKAFTATVFEMLSEEGKLDWNKPIREYIPGYRLWDEFATDRITSLDWASHRSGLPRHDLLWVLNSGLNVEHTIANARYLEPSKDFRTTWQYNNLGYVTLGYLISQAAGKPWHQVVQERILDPLGMKSTSFDVDGLVVNANFASPYAVKNDKVYRVPVFKVGAGAAAGAINSNVVDMSKWIMLQLNQGKVGEKQLVEPSGLAKLYTPQIPLGATGGLPGVEHQSYGIGWFVESYHGKYHVYHGGTVPGFTSVVSLLPKENIGIVVLTNADVSVLPSLVAYSVIDRLLGLSPTDWSGLFKQSIVAQESALKALANEAGQPNTVPSHPLAEYCGEYIHPAYGTVSIRQNGTSLEAQYYEATIPLKHKHYDQFIGEVTWMTPIYLPVRFETDVQGDIGKVLITFENLVSPIAFTRKLSTQLTDPAFLERLVGVYDFQGQPIQIELKGNVLQMVFPGQPAYKLVPANGTRFTLESTPGFTCEFVMPADEGSANKLKLNQPGYVFEAIRKAE